MSSARSIIWLVAPLITAGGLVAPARAGTIVNGGFETGDFTGFATTGVATIETSAFGSGPAEGTYQALFTNESGAVSASDLESFLGIASGSLDALGNGTVVNGSALQQSFMANAGDTLTLQWNFLTSEDSGTGFNDFAFVVLSSLGTLADTNSSLLMSSSTVLLSETGYNMFTTTIPSAGTYRLGLGVVNVSDVNFESGLLVDDIRLSAVPEPSGLILGGTGILIVAAHGLRRRRGAKGRRHEQQ